MNVRGWVSALPGIAGMLLMLAGCGNNGGLGPDPAQFDKPLSLDELRALGAQLDPGEVVEVRLSEMDSDAVEHFRGWFTHVPESQLMEQTIEVAGDQTPASLSSRGSTRCTSGSFTITHKPGCPRNNVVDGRRVSFYDSCPHQGYTIDNPGYQATATCAERGCPYRSQYYRTWHRPR